MCVRSEALPGQNCASGNGSTETETQESQSPKSVVGSFSLESVSASWDDEPSIRERIRMGRNLLVRINKATGEIESFGFIEATCENLKLNGDVLKPVLQVMKLHDLQLPSIESLISAIEEFYVLSKVCRSSDQVYQDSWCIRRMIGKVKKFIYRPLPPQDCLETISWMLAPHDLTSLQT